MSQLFLKNTIHRQKILLESRKTTSRNLLRQQSRNITTFQHQRRNDIFNAVAHNKKFSTTNSPNKHRKFGDRLPIPLQKEDEEEKKHENNPEIPQLFNDLNKAIDENPLALLAGLSAVKVSMFFVLQRILATSGVFCGPELAVGQLIATWTGKFRQPLNIGLAVAIGKMAPILRTVNIGKCFATKKPKPLTEEETKLYSDKCRNGGLPEEEIENLTKEQKEGLFKWFVLGPIEKHGFPFYLTMRITNAFTIAGAAYFVGQGVDIMGYFQSWGMSQTIGDNFGALGGAMVINTCFIPLHLWGGVQTSDHFKSLFAGKNAIQPEVIHPLKEKAERMEQLRELGIFNENRGKKKPAQTLFSKPQTENEENSETHNSKPKLKPEIEKKTESKTTRRRRKQSMKNESNYFQD